MPERTQAPRLAPATPGLLLVFIISGFYLPACRQAARPIRILTAGIMQEADTFNPNPTQEIDFTVHRGEEVTQGADWAKVLSDAGVEIIPTLHVSAEPGGVVSRQAYEKFKTEILTEAQRAGKVDGFYLEMHGALVVEGYQDAQTDFVQSIRAIVGPEAIISGSFDLHGNISPQLAKELDILTAYRTAPHVDQKETRVRAVRLLLNAIAQHQHPVIALVKLPILVPGERAITSKEPLKSIYAQLPLLAQKRGLIDGSIFVGHSWGDVPYASMSVAVVADSAANRQLALREARQLAALLWEQRAGLKFDVPTASIDKAITTALAAPEPTVFISDSGDNVTGGAPGDSTIVLERLRAMRVKDAVVAGIVDPSAVEACERTGLGKRIKLKIGGRLDSVHSHPLEIEAVIHYISTGPAGVGRPSKRAAVLDWDGIWVVLLDTRRAFTSPEDFKQVGIDPLAHKIVVVKLGYLFQALRDIAPRTIMALTPGCTYQLIEELPYKNIRRPMYSFDPNMTWDERD
jgi:microcystin degradation protein MlrC